MWPSSMTRKLKERGRLSGRSLNAIGESRPGIVRHIEDERQSEQSEVNLKEVRKLNERQRRDQRMILNEIVQAEVVCVAILTGSG